jgi:hypothetical protein
MYRSRYWWLAAILFGAMFVQAVNQYWSGDFWEHAAVVRELARHPVAPRHPLFAIDAPHPFFTPYAVLAAWLVRTIGLSPITALSSLGVVNLICLIIVFYLFVSRVLSPDAAFWGLLFTLVLWGMSPWRYSGFLHLGALGFVLPYPSIFAMWLMLLMLYALLRFADEGNLAWAAVIAAGVAIVLLTHPITGIVLATGLLAFSVRPFLKQPRRFVMLAVVVLVVAAAAAWFWPYYPWFRLIATGSRTYAVPNLAMYDSPLRRSWPALLGAPFVARRLAADKLDGLGLFTFTLFLLYALGAFISNGPLGRVLPALVLGLHLSLADGVAELEARFRKEHAHATLRYLYGAVALIALFGLVNVAPGILRAVPRTLLPASVRADPRLEREVDVYRTIASAPIGGDDVVMADLNVSRHVPAFAGKVVAFIDPEAFIPDEDARRQAVDRFFAEITTAERDALIARYDVKFVAIDEHNPFGASFRRWVDTQRVVFDDGRLRLVRVD